MGELEHEGNFLQNHRMIHKIDWPNRFTLKTLAPMLPSWHSSSHGSQF